LLAQQQQQQQQGPRAAQDAAEHLTDMQELGESLLEFWIAIDTVWSDAYADADPADPC
jgi:hypothetical protein